MTPTANSPGQPLRIACLGMATLDTMLFAPSFATGHDAVNILGRTHQSPGGKGFVAAWTLAALGARVTPISLIGGCSQLTSKVEHLLPTDTLLPRLDEDNQVWMTISDSQHVVQHIRVGAVVDQSINDDSQVVDAIRESEVVYLSVEETTLLLNALASIRKNAVLVLNLCHPVLIYADRHRSSRLVENLLARTNVLLMNASEASLALEVLGKRNWTEIELPYLEDIIITEGADGGRAATRPFDVWSRWDAVLADKVVSVVGAGDTFNGAFLYSRYHLRSPLNQACRFAAIAAAAAVSSPASIVPETELARLSSGLTRG